MVNVTNTGDFWIGNGTFVNEFFKLYVSGTAKFTGDILAATTVRVGYGGGSQIFNTAVGSEVLKTNTTGNFNVALGSNALGLNTVGSLNTAVGVDALYSNKGNFSNTAVGAAALTALGGPGNNNTALGDRAGRFISGGLIDHTTSSNSTFIGQNTQPLGDNQTNQIVIGYAAIGLGSNTTVIGNPSTTRALIFGNLTASGSITATQGFTGSLFGTASWAINALTASFGANFTASNALINGTITAQTLVVQTITSSVDFVTGSTRFGTLLSNTHQFTGSVSITGSLTVNGSSPIFASQTSSMTVASASFATTASYVLSALSSSYSLTASYALNAGGAVSAFPFTGSALITGSLGVTGSVSITGSLNVGNSNIEYQENTNVTTGTWRVISSEPTASYRAAFFDYVMFSGSVARAGTVYSVWSASYAEYYENYTGDVGGSTSGVTLQAAISGSNIQLQATSSNNAWTIRSLVRML